MERHIKSEVFSKSYLCVFVSTIGMTTHNETGVFTAVRIGSACTTNVATISCALSCTEAALGCSVFSPSEKLWVVVDNTLLTWRAVPLHTDRAHPIETATISVRKSTRQTRFILILLKNSTQYLLLFNTRQSIQFGLTSPDWMWRTPVKSTAGAVVLWGHEFLWNTIKIHSNIDWKQQKIILRSTESKPKNTQYLLSIASNLYYSCLWLSIQYYSIWYQCWAEWLSLLFLLDSRISILIKAKKDIDLNICIQTFLQNPTFTNIMRMSLLHSLPLLNL